MYGGFVVHTNKNVRSWFRNVRFVLSQVQLWDDYSCADVCTTSGEIGSNVLLCKQIEIAGIL
jgi:hypothetical protein